MTATPLTVWDNSGTPQAHRLLSGTTLESVQLGAATGFTAATIDGGAGRLPQNRIAIFKGDPYLMHRGTVYVFNEGTGVWDSTGYTITSPPTSDDQAISGIHVVQVAGVEYLCGWWQVSAGINGRGWWTDDGTTFNETANISMGSSTWPYYSVIYDGRLWWCSGNTSTRHVMAWTPTSSAVDIYDVGAGNGGENGFIYDFENRLIWIGTTRTANERMPILMKEFVAGGWVDVSISGGSNPGLTTSLFASPDGALGLFEYTGNLYAVFWSHTNTFPSQNEGEMKVIQFVPSGGAGTSFAETDVSTTVVPSAWRTGGAFDGEGSLNTQVLVMIDQADDPTNPTVHWVRMNSYTSGSGETTFWTFNGPGSAATVASTAISSDFAIPQGPITGVRTYTDGDTIPSIFNPAQIGTDVQFDFSLADAIDGSSPGDQTLRLYYNQGGHDWQIATIQTGTAPTTVSGADGPPSISTNTFTGVTPGTSVYRARWDANADGLGSPGLKYKLKLKVI